MTLGDESEGMVSAPHSQNGPDISFGKFRFATQSGELFCGDDRIELQPQVSALLALFLSNPDRLLTLEEINDQLWPNLTVNYEQRIRAMVMTLRGALRDTAKDSDFIETLPRKGYRFVHSIGGAKQASEQRAWMIWLSAVIGISAVVFVAIWIGASWDVLQARSREPIILAILPVDTLTASDTEQSLAAEFTHQLISRTARVDPENFRVIGQSSARRYSQRPRDLMLIVEQLGADFIVETSLSSAGAQVRVVTTMIDVTNEQVVWSEILETTPLGLWRTSDRIALAIGQRLGFGDGATVVSLGTLYDPDPMAYEAYLAGLLLLQSDRDDRVDAARSAFERAVEIDPDFVLARVRLGRALIRSDEEFSAAAIVQYDAAIAINDDHAEAYFRRGLIRLFELWDWDGGETDIRTAVELDPGQAVYRVIYSLVLRARGDLDGALQEAEYAVAADPMSAVALFDSAYVYLALGRPQEAYDLCERNHRYEISDPVGTRGCMLTAALEMEDETLSREMIGLLTGLSESPPSLDWSLPFETVVQDYWVWYLAQIQPEGEWFRGFAEMAGTQARLGRTEDVLSSLDRAIEERDIGAMFLMTDIRYEAMRDDPRFLDRVARVGIWSLPPVEG